MNDNENIPQFSANSLELYLERELEVGNTYSTKGVISISVMNDLNSSSSNSNPLNGPHLNEILPKSHEIVVSPDLSLKKNYGFNSSTVVIPVRYILLLISYFKIFFIEKNFGLSYYFVFFYRLKIKIH